MIVKKKRKLSGLVIKRWCNSQQLKGMQYVVNKYVKGVPSFDKRYTKGIPFIAEMVFKRSRDWTSGDSPPGIKFCSVPPGFSIRQ